MIRRLLRPHMSEGEEVRLSPAAASTGLPSHAVAEINHYAATLSTCDSRPIAAQCAPLAPCSSSARSGMQLKQHHVSLEIPAKPPRGTDLCVLCSSSRSLSRRRVQLYDQDGAGAGTGTRPRHTGRAKCRRRRAPCTRAEGDIQCECILLPRASPQPCTVQVHWFGLLRALGPRYNVTAPRSALPACSGGGATEAPAPGPRTRPDRPRRTLGISTVSRADSGTVQRKYSGAPFSRSASTSTRRRPQQVPSRYRRQRPPTAIVPAAGRHYTCASTWPCC